jgi:hypothetical protein
MILKIPYLFIKKTFHQENIEKISSEITRRNSTISSPHEVSDYFFSINNFFESIFSFEFFELLGSFTPILFILFFYAFLQNLQKFCKKA